MYQLSSLEISLKQFFGYDSFRPGQKEIIEQILQERDILAVMPTGAGKSLCFQLPALLKTGVMIVVSPLIALMQDQVAALVDNGIGATYINSSISGSEIRIREKMILSGKIKLVYVAPERLVSEQFIPFLDEVRSQVGISAFTIDEAHCISEWGHDFRPEYRQLKTLRRRYRNIAILAFTATATERVRTDIIQQLALENPVTHLASFNRANLYYEVKPKDKHGYNQLLKAIKAQKNESGIVYCLSRRTVDDIADRLARDRISALPYHAGLEPEIRTSNQERFLRDDVQIIVATIAFGLGINKLNVRFVFHYDLPRSLEGYYQESGRGGRDGEPTNCILFYSGGDRRRLEYFIDQKTDEQEKRIAYQQLNQVIDYAESTVCRRTIQLRYFGETFKGNCQNCDNCLDPKPHEDWTIEAQKFLSCVYRCQERFGANYIIDILRGSRKEKIEQNGHHLLSTYGIGKDRSAEDWKLLVRSLLHQGLISETTDGYRVLKLNKKSWEILRKQRQVQVAVAPTMTQSSTLISSGSIEVEMLFEELRKLTKRIADKQGVFPYIIFTDASLRAMAQQKPKTLGEFAKISGVNTYKLEQYGAEFVSQIRAFCQEHEAPIPLPSGTQMMTLQLFQQGFGIVQIAQRRNLSVATIINHLCELIEFDQPIDVDQLVSRDHQQAIFQAIQKLGDKTLTPLREHLGENYSYDEIRLARAKWRREQKRF